MTYRYTGNEPTVCDVTSSVDLHMLNGTDMVVAIPCSYAIDGELVPIQLEDEGYGPPRLAIAERPDGLTSKVSLEGNVITLSFDAQCSEAIEQDLSTEITLFIDRSDGVDTITDAVLRGKLVIVAGPLSQ
ncbi:hypothetical protein [uncultured Halomonas sp.]|uniref:hypothetical protein n=1 Tax=uncultured Halomonas sp. TaxID=173971 RepID=UPI00260F87F4|nr:hypothetical protein [uncultured Halomonas sp.]